MDLFQLILIRTWASAKSDVGLNEFCISLIRAGHFISFYLILGYIYFCTVDMHFTNCLFPPPILKEHDYLLVS